MRSGMTSFKIRSRIHLWTARSTDANSNISRMVSTVGGRSVSCLGSGSLQMKVELQGGIALELLSDPSQSRSVLVPQFTQYVSRLEYW